MRRHTVWACATAASLFGTATALLKPRDGGAQPKVVSLALQRRHVEDPVARDKLRRRQEDGTVDVVLDNMRNLYLLNASLGTPPQEIRFHLDTGSSDLWTNSGSSALCGSIYDPCGESGTYDANASSTYRYVDSDFRISYVDGSGARGDHAVDTIRVGDVVLDDLQIGIGYRSSSGESILGIGYMANEAAVSRGTSRPYPNLPELMRRSGQINSNAYSLWLNDLDASAGSLLFGGVDTEKYVGQLETLPIQTTYGDSAPTEFIITLTDLSFVEDGRDPVSIATGRAEPVLLDSGSSLTYLPDDLAAGVMDAVGAEFDRENGIALVPCSLARSTSTVDFRFSQPVISVQLNELVLAPERRYSSSPRLTPTLADGRTEACFFGIMPAGELPPVLGDTFLRSAYVVYDLENHEISLAQTNFNATADRILEIGSGPDAVPDAAAVQDPVPAVSAPAGGARIGNRFGGGDGDDTSTGSQPTSTSTAAACRAVGAVPSRVLVAAMTLGASLLSRTVTP